MSDIYSQRRTVILDVDGTLVASAPIHREAFQTVLTEHGILCDPGSFLGLSTERAFEEMLRDRPRSVEISALAEEKRRRATTLMYAAPDLLIPGAIDVLNELSEHFRLALCSSGSRRTVEAARERGLPVDLCEVVITAEDCLVSKPHPEPYLTCLARLDVRATLAVAVEDTPIGISSALAAGLRSVLVGPASDVSELNEAIEWGRVRLANALTDVPSVIESLF